MQFRPSSASVYEKGCLLIPGGVNSPVRSFKGVDLSPPLIVESGFGSLIRDIDGNEYIDYCTGWGSMILGHAYPAVVEATSKRLQHGSSFGIATGLEVEMANKLAFLVPSIEKTRLVSSGTEATMTAIRLARGFTGRKKILKFTGHYHGHVDALLIEAGSGVSNLNAVATSQGIPPGMIADTLCFSFNHIDAIRAFFETDTRVADLAAVILEPVAGNMGVVLPDPLFLQILREETTKAGTLLIFDEVITGFRVGLKGAGGIYNIDPDLICLGKIIGGGFPLAAVGGKKKILDCLAPLGQVYQAGTLSGNPVAVIAGLTTLSVLEEPLFFENLEKKTERFIAPIAKIIKSSKKNICLNRCGSMFSLFFGTKEVKCKEDVLGIDQKLFAKFFRFLFTNGIYIPPSPHESWFISSAHKETQLDFTADKIIQFIEKINC